MKKIKTYEELENIVRKHYAVEYNGIEFKSTRVLFCQLYSDLAEGKRSKEQLIVKIIDIIRKTEEVSDEKLNSFCEKIDKKIIEYIICSYSLKENVKFDFKDYLKQQINGKIEDIYYEKVEEEYDISEFITQIFDNVMP